MPTAIAARPDRILFALSEKLTRASWLLPALWPPLVQHPFELWTLLKSTATLAKHGIWRY